MVEEGYYDEQDLHEQAECLHSEHRDELMSICQQQEKREQEIQQYYKRREQQWKELPPVRNDPPMSGDPSNVRLGGLLRVPPAQLLPRARYFQSTPQTENEEATDPMGADPRLSTMVRVQTTQSERPVKQVTYGHH